MEQVSANVEDAETDKEDKAVEAAPGTEDARAGASAVASEDGKDRKPS